MQGVTGFLTNAAKVQPLLIVLEDLHDADQGTLEMLTYVSRNLPGARLMLVGTYRDVEVDRSHPLSSVLAELRRISTFGRVTLRGLTADEVQRMLEGISQDSVGGQPTQWH
jgi:predicted ATPase